MGCAGTVDGSGGDSASASGSGGSRPGGTPATDEGGFIGIGTDSKPPEAPPPGLPAPAGALAEIPMRRLSQQQYANVLADIVLSSLSASGKTLVTQLPGIINQAVYPADSLKNLDGGQHGGLYRTDQVVQQPHIDAGYAIAAKLAAEMTSGPRLGELVGTCATDTDVANDDACLRTFITRFGRLVLRRPLQATEVDHYRGAALPPLMQPDNVALIVALLFSAPDFLYVVETGAPSTKPDAGRIELTVHEVATRLSLHFWDRGPDEELAALADSKKLLDPDVYKAQVARLSADERAAAPLRDFFAQWFRLQETPEFQTRLGDATYRALAGSFTPTADTRKHVNDEIGDLVSYLYRNGGSLKDVLTDKRAFARAADVATLYGVSPWDGKSMPAPMEGRNLLGRVAFVASGLPNTRPVMKGVRIRNALLCQPLPPPPPAAMNVVVELAPDLTTREVIEKLTESPGSSCASCHKTLINPLGFISENFDSFGRARKVQQLFDDGAKPTVQKPVKSEGVVSILPGDKRQAAGIEETAALILESGQFERCFAQQYFRFTFGRKEYDFDRHVLAQLAYSANQGQPLMQVLQQVALRPEFQMRLAQ